MGEEGRLVLLPPAAKREETGGGEGERGGRGDPPGCPEVCTGLRSERAKLRQKNPGKTCTEAPVCPGCLEHLGSPRCGSCSSPSIWGASGFGFHCTWGTGGNEPVGALLYCSSALTPPGFHTALCAAKPPSACKANVIFEAFFAPPRAQFLPPRNTCPAWLLGCSFSLHEQRTKK